MRLDKFLKVSRIIKRRTIANEVCDKGKVLVNDRIAKASTSIKEGDMITITMGANTLKVEVLQVTQTARKEAAAEMYRVIAKSKEMKV